MEYAQPFQSAAPALATVRTSLDPHRESFVRRRAQRLHTSVYLQEGFISSDDVDPSGLYQDEYVDRSVYLYARNERRDTTCRYIQADKKEGGILSLPTLKHFAVDPDVIREVAGIDRLTDLSPKKVIEISALATRQNGEVDSESRDQLDATRLLYATILRHSLDAGHQLWVMNTHEELGRHLKILLGKDQVRQIGEPKEYLGSMTVPYALNPQKVVASALKDTTRLGDMKREYLKQTLQGVKGEHLSSELRRLLEDHEIEYVPPTSMQRLKRHQKALAYTAVAAYATARAVPVANVEGFEGNPYVFWGIDVGTAFPYTWGLIETVTAKKPMRKVVGGAVAAASFAAPYVYFWAEGEEYPAWVNGVVAGIVGAAGIMAVNGIRKDMRLETALRQEDYQKK